ncbi:MAG: glycosyltransferase family 4 protein, partial [Patescibacteria group bacterium]|nr:glycosyltransferase family 4 protein [Patescibacteria group bacterium]
IITPRPRTHYDDPTHNLILVGRSVKMNTPFNTMADIGFEADGEEIQDILDTEKFDIIHFHEPWVPLLSRQILSRSKSINVATFHAKLPESIISKSIMNTVIPYTKSILNYIHLFTAVSEAASEHLRSMTKDEIIIVPNGIDYDKYAQTAKIPKPDNKKKTILYLGRLEKRKGVDHLISAYAKLRQSHDDVKLLIAGNGVKSTSLQRMVSQYEIPDVTFLGFIHDNDKPTLMHSADLFCSPALYGESFGVVLLEAMAVYTPIVAGNNTGYSSVMTGRGRLSLVTATQTTDFAQRLELMLYDNEVRKLWQDWAKKEIIQYNFPNITDKYEQVYKKAMRLYA